MPMISRSIGDGAKSSGMLEAERPAAAFAFFGASPALALGASLVPLAPARGASAAFGADFPADFPAGFPAGFCATGAAGAAGAAGSGELRRRSMAMRSSALRSSASAGVSGFGATFGAALFGSGFFGSGGGDKMSPAASALRFSSTKARWTSRACAYSHCVAS